MPKDKKITGNKEVTREWEVVLFGSRSTKKRTPTNPTTPTLPLAKHGNKGFQELQERRRGK